MAIRKKTASAGPKVWTVAELGAFYTEHRSELHAHASRILKDSTRAEEVIQDALIKIMLAAPELESTEHALGYMHRTIENLCIDIFRIEGRRPNLVVLDDAAAEIESNWQESGDHSDVIAAADDAAIVRQALSMLSPAERAALVMWEMEGRSTEEIAAELGIKESAVRHTVSRARASLRRVLTELVIDEERGLTALDMLSTTYKKAADLAKKSSKVALSLILVVFAFLGFTNLTANTPAPELAKTTTSKPVQSATKNGSTKTTTSSKPPTKNPVLTINKNVVATNVKATALKIPGLDKNGVPTGFVVADSSGNVGTLYNLNRPAVATETELTASAITKTISGAANIFLSQTFVTDANGLTYTPALSYGSSGMWAPLNTSLTSVDTERLVDGNYLVTAYIKVEYALDTTIQIAAAANGRDLAAAPRQVITRLVLNPSKTQILAQAIYVVEKGAK